MQSPYPRFEVGTLHYLFNIRRLRCTLNIRFYGINRTALMFRLHELPSRRAEKKEGSV